MARMTAQEKQAAVSALIPADGWIEHQVLSDTLEAAGNGAAITEILRVVQSGNARQRVARNEAGKLVVSYTSQAEV